MIDRAVDVEVQAEVEVVVVERRHQVGRHQGPVGGVGRGGRVLHRGGGDALDRVLAGRADLDEQLAVLPEAVVDEVVVVADDRGAAHDQLGIRAALGRHEGGFTLGEHLEVAPGRVADGALEHADRVRNLQRSAQVVVDERRQERGAGGAVDPGRQRAEEQAEAVLAAVHVGAEVPARRRVHVRHENLGEMRLVEHRTPALAVAHVDVREHDARALVDAQAKAPDVPVDARARDGVAGAAGLGRMDRAGRRAQRPAGGDLVRRVSPVVLRQRHDALVHHAGRLVSQQVDDREQPLDRLGVVVRAGRVPVAGHLHQARALVLRGQVVAGGQRQAEHVAGRQAAPRQPGDHLRVVEGGGHGAGELLEQHHGLARGRFGGFDRAARDVDDGGAEAGLVQEVHQGPARLRISLGPGEHVGLRRLDQLDQRVPGLVVRFAGGAQ